MSKLRTALIATVPLACLALAPLQAAQAYGHDRDHGHGGYHRGWGPIGAVAAVVGVAAAVVTAPFVIIAQAAEPRRPYYYGQPYNYYPPAGPEAYARPTPGYDYAPRYSPAPPPYYGTGDGRDYDRR